MERIRPFRTLDALRGLAAIWVVMTHSCDRFLATADPALSSQPLYAFAMRGQLGVVAFFIISGYCIVAAAHGALYSGKTIGRYSFERVRRIFPPYWTALVLGVIVLIVLHIAEAHRLIPKINHPQAIESSPLYWFANLTLTQAEWNTGYENIVFWSLCYELAFYAVVGACLWLAQQTAKKRDMAAGQGVLIFGIALTTIVSLLFLVISGQALFPFDLWPQFGLGGMLFYLIESRKETVAGYGPACACS